MTKELMQAIGIRCLRTGAQTLLSFMTIGQAVFEVNWVQAISVTVTAMIMSFLTSIVTGLPEVGSDGAFIVDDSDPETTRWILQYDGNPDDLKVGDKLTFEVKEGEE